MDEMLLELVWKCQEKEGATNDDVEHMKTRTPPETRGQKCLFACIGESIGLVRALIFQQKLLCLDMSMFSFF